MTDPQTFITHMTNMVYLSTITQILHQTAYEEAQNETAQPLNQAIGSFTSADMKEGWEITHQSVTAAVREIQAQAWEEGHAAIFQIKDTHLTERLQAEITQLETEAFEVGKKEAITSLVYIIEGLQQDGETDQNMAYVPGETGRQKAKETWEEFLENPALYISEKIAPSIIGATYTTVIEESEAHIQGKQAEAWEEGYSAGNDDYACCQQFGETTNPYKEKTQ